MVSSIFVSRSFAHLRKVFAEYREMTGCDIQAVIEDEFFGSFKDGLLAIGE